jgi:exonuclease III
MKIINSSPWNSSDIHKLFKRCVRECEKKEKPKYTFRSKNRYFRLTIENGNNHFGFWGHASLGNHSYTGTSIYLKFGTRENQEKGIKESFLDKEMPTENKIQLARVMIHEYYHSMGFMDFDKFNYRGDWSKTWNVDWVKDYPIRKKEIMSQPKIDIKLRRYQAAIQNLEKAETRLRRAKTLFNKWNLKVNRYKKVYNYK